MHIKTDYLTTNPELYIMRYPKSELSGDIRILHFYNINTKEISLHNDWKKYEIIFETTKHDSLIEFGVILKSEGKIWIDNIEFEEVDNVETDYNKLFKGKIPTNLDFENIVIKEKDIKAY